LPFQNFIYNIINHQAFYVSSNIKSKTIMAGCIFTYNIPKLLLHADHSYLGY